ncbi:MAG: holo-ACP synthase [Melioribacteraceae bacterium]|nr:holo-ACP synthase [Melioribacteraceae bacterium]MCF8352931.1 holo-ACP synthase [Melioribacteraceae bacterium]MCF8395272.1 holo-ACP synthase [Melioribacteraceae bacterium]MCF8417448.1 holo-ACP synthase [Melioribacteraceae bacterium]
MVFGVGIDIIEIERIKKSVDKFEELFLNKLFTESEIEYCLSKKNKYQHLAARFAAKEAIAKALATGWSKGFRWKDIEIINELNGLPKVTLYGALQKFLGTDKSLKITMSHSENYVACFAILYADNNGNSQK